MKVSLILRCSLVLLALGVAVALGASHPVWAAQPQGGGSTAQILFDSPIYAGHNNGFAEGPVGTSVTLELRYMNQPPANWAIGGNADLWIYRVQNEAAGDHTCSGTPGAIHIGAMPVLNGSGGATLAFIWPAAANDAAGPDFGACVNQGGAPNQYQFSTDLDSFQYFRVLTHAPATLEVTPTVAHRGDTITVTGHNWGPIFSDVAGSTIHVAIGHCNSGFSLGGHAVTSAPGGNFSTTFTIPSTAPYTIGVQACAFSDYQHVDNLDGSSQTPPTFQVAALAVATATPLPPTATPAPTPGHSGGKGCFTGMVVMLSSFFGIIFISRRRTNLILSKEKE